jgi:Xaa-Pro aminopeptidase
MNNIEKLIGLFPQNMQCAMITSEVNRRYFTGMKSSSGTLICFKEKAYFITDFRYIEKANKFVKNAEVIEQKNITLQIDELFKKHKINRVSIEDEYMTVSQLNSLKISFPNVEFDFSNVLSKVISDLRIIKSKSEINKILEAQAIAEETFKKILDYISVSRSERDISRKIDNIMLKLGAECPSFDTIVLSGINSSMPHGVPSNQKVVKNSFVLMDFGAVVDGYHSDMTRTVCLGKPSDEMERIYNLVLQAQVECIKKVKANIPCCDIDKHARDIFGKMGYSEFFGHSLGHGVGIEIHEAPSLSEKNSSLLKENMIVTVEPGIYLAKKFGVRIEDFVLVTENGCKNLTNCPKELISL